MKNSILLLLAVFLTFTACEQCDPDWEESTVRAACSVDNPIEDLAWLRDEVQGWEQDTIVDFKYSYIAQAEYQGQTVFIYGNCCPFCNSISLVYNCSGEQISQLGYREEDINFSILDRSVVIWKPKGYVCNL